VTAAHFMPRVMVGDPAEVIAAEAQAWNADLVAMATHGRTGLARLVLGSVAAGTLQRVDVPVLFVRPGAAKAGTPTTECSGRDAEGNALNMVLDAREAGVIEHALQDLLLPERDPALAEPARALLERFRQARSSDLGGRDGQTPAAP
jgi:hypothetical protein